MHLLLLFLFIMLIVKIHSLDYERKFDPSHLDERIMNSKTFQGRKSDEFEENSFLLHALTAKEYQSKVANLEERRLVNYYDGKLRKNPLFKNMTEEEKYHLEHNRSPNVRMTNINRAKANFTTCDQFAKKAYFHPKDIFDRQWLSFFIWSDRETLRIESSFNFSIPTMPMVKKYKNLYGEHLEIEVDWNQPKLVMNIDGHDNLIIALDKKGYFVIITEHKIPQIPKTNDFKLPTPKIRMKLVKRYLLIMYCGSYVLAYACAVQGEEPRDPIAAARSTGYHGYGGPTEKRRKDLE